MRSWPIRIKLLALPLGVAPALLVALWLPAQSTRPGTTIEVLTLIAFLVLVAGAWLIANTLERRIALLTELTAQLQDRAGLSSPTDSGSRSSAAASARHSSSAPPSSWILLRLRAASASSIST
jgi:hypothetical protein